MIYTDLKLDLGCGRRKRSGYFGVDCQKLDGVDLVCDCNLPIPLPDNCATDVNANDFLEHVENNKRIHIMTEIWRMLKPGGIFTSSTPDASVGQGAFQDPTHYAFWTHNSFLYYTNDAYRALYGITAKFDIVSLKVIPLNPIGVGYIDAILKAVK
jgi:predicted SAM-dependent methyltransferase